MPEPLQHVPDQTRSVPMKVLALGLPRTGTRSMATALEILGYKHCAHGFDLIDSLSYTLGWDIALHQKYHKEDGEPPLTKPFWDSLLGHCQAVTDAPCAIFWRELIDVYPDAKIVLVERDEDRWYESFCEGVIEPMFSPSGQFTRKYVEPLLGSRVGAVSFKTLCGWLGAETEAGMKGNARGVYRRHCAEIRQEVDKERILDFRLEEGWGPLCRFLGVEEPKNVGFPWINEGEALKAKIREVEGRMMKEAGSLLMKSVLPALIVGLVGVVAWRWS